MEPSRRAEAIKRALEENLGAVHVDVVDESAKHSTHPGAHGGGGHFRIVVVSDRFLGLGRLASQRLVYDALADLMVSDIHAVTMSVFTEKQWSGLEADASEIRD